jgi:hypothetical protein
VLQARELNTMKQRELQWKRVTAIQEVLGAARPLLKALKEEHKARVSVDSDAPRMYCVPCACSWDSTRGCSLVTCTNRVSGLRMLVSDFRLDTAMRSPS